MTATVSIRGLEVRYGDRVGLRDLDVELTGPCTVAVIGPNGSGKSTLLAAIAGLATPSAGEVVVDAPSPPALVLQSTDVDRSLPITVRDTVRLARYPRLGLLRRFSGADHEAVEDAMARLSVDDLAGRQLHELSGGQRQRVLVAQGLAQDASILLLDEPVTGLDVVSRDVILEAIDAERAEGRLVVTTTHNLEDARRSDVVVLLDTAPVAVGTPEAVLTDQHLGQAFGGRFLRIGERVVLDDPHHQPHGH
ncbi:MAG: metal ABC transporter ATP-binding protein [Actinomycetota bacterium]|nr:metal ABC transporter ATP-binding protein [Actinomycetota bacterium]